MSHNTISLDDLRARVQGHNLRKQAATATDPAEKGTATATKDPALSDDKSKLPPSLENESNEGKKLEDKDLQPSSTGKNMPVSPKDGNAEDKKGVEKAAGLRDRVRNLLGKSATATSPAESKTVAKQATEAEPATTLTPESLFKLASAIFETEDGVDSILPVLRKKAGQDAAIELIKAAAAEYRQAQEEAFYAQELQKQAHAEAVQHQAVIAQIVKSASSKEEAARLVKAASAHYENTLGLNEFEKLAYAQGPEDAAAMMGGAEGGGEPAIEGAQEPSLEQIAQLIQLAVQNQEISPEDGEAMLQELASAAGGEGGAPAGEGGAPPGAGAGGAPEGDPAATPAAPPEAPPEDTTKEASAASRSLFAKLRNKTK